MGRAQAPCPVGVGRPPGRWPQGVLCADKCFWGRTSVLYLGHVVTGDGTRPNPKLCSAVQEFPRPSTVQQVRSFLGMCSFFRTYIPRFADLAAPLHSLTHHSRKGTPIADSWGEEHEQSFEALKAALVSPPCLRQPDFAAPFYLHTDASGVALGACLTQPDE